MKFLFVTLIASVLLLTGCVTKPTNISPVDNFQASKYLGRWYEIARLDNSFETGMTQVYAQYSLNSDGSIKVVNSGVNPETGRMASADGVAKFVDKTDVGFLKVSFFRPFYGAYVIFGLDDYEYAYVGGPDTKYLWLLSRTPTVPNEVKQNFIAKSKSAGFDTDKLVWVKQ
tara:strand:- start:465 stop:977 length:513 start_codon:yes stop_codon:yes gene_type:complete